MNKSRAYFILNIKKNEILNEKNLKDKYRKALLKYHPDKNKENNELFTEVKEAFIYINKELNEVSPLFYLDEDYIHPLYHILKHYIYEPFHKHVHSYKIYELNPSIDNLLNKELYYIDEYDLYVPLWHHELLFEEKKLKIKIFPKLENYMMIDEDNHLHLYLDIQTKQIGDKIELLNKSISFLYDEEFYKNKIKIIKNIGIPIIKYNIYDISELSCVYVHMN
tara:strand:- start:55 stop:720 length:666 start_codon:yes stop_codon:yes gene_type:complete